MRLNRQLEANETMWKSTTETLYHVKQRCLLVQVAGSPASNENQNIKMKVFKNFLKSSKSLQKPKWLPMLHACVTLKSIKIICVYSKISGVFIQKYSCLQHIKFQNILIYNLFSKPSWSLLKVGKAKMAAYVTHPCNTKGHQKYLFILRFLGF